MSTQKGVFRKPKISFLPMKMFYLNIGMTDLDVGKPEVKRGCDGEWQRLHKAISLNA